MRDEWRSELDDITPLSEFRAKVTATPMPEGERPEIVGQAIVLLGQLWVHADQKRAVYGYDPVSRLRELLADCSDPELEDARFHRELVEIFASCRDLHTSYVLPTGFQHRMAFLPFAIEAYGSADAPHYIVNHISDAHAGLEAGVPVVRYNGEAVHRAAAAQSERSPGATDAARRARGIMRLTSRYVADAYLPDEDSVTILVDGEERERCFPWQVGRLRVSAARKAAETPDRTAAWRVGVDRGGELRGRARKALLAGRATTADPVWEWEDPDGLMAYRVVGKQIDPGGGHERDAPNRAEPRYGYLRIYSFPEEAFDRFLADVAELLDSTLRGLIIDVRGNPGGLITAAEGLLLLLTGRTLSPQGYQFGTSPLARALVFNVGELKAWKLPMDEAQKTGERHTAPKPLVSRSVYEPVRQAYTGPITVLVDAQSYSATDMFAAAIQDQGVGRILSTAARTGGGGASVVTHEQLVNPLRGGGGDVGPMPLRSLASGASFTVAIRRSVRSGENSGRKLEDIAVAPDVPVHELTLDDLVHHNRDLIAAAIALLEEQRWPVLSAQFDSEQMDVIVSARNVDHVEVITSLGRIWDSPYSGEEVRVPGRRILAENPASYSTRIVGLRDERRVVSIPYPWSSTASDEFSVREQ